MKEKVSSSCIRLTIIKTTIARTVAKLAFIITFLLIAGAVAAIFLYSSDSSKHETEWSFDGKFSAFATNKAANLISDESIKIDSNNNNITPLYNSSNINSPYIKEYSMPKGTWPNGILVDKKGIIWTVGTKSQTLISFDPKKGRIVSEYPIKKDGFRTSEILEGSSSSSPLPSKQQATIPMMTWAIVEDNNDGSIWFSQADSPNPLWRFDPLTKRFEVIENITGAPYQMKVDNKTGDIWFTTYTDNKIGIIQKVEGEQVRPTSSFDNNTNNSGNNSSTLLHYKVKEFNLDRQAFPTGLYLDGQDSIWVAQSLNDKVVHFKAVRDNNGKVIDLVKVLEIPSNSFSSLPAPSVISSSSPNKMKKLFAGPYDIVVYGADVWVTEHDANFLTRYNNNSKYSHALVTKFPTSSNPHQYLSLPFWLRETQDGHGLWFNEHYGNRISFFNITDTTLTEYEVPTRNQSLGYIGNALNFAVDPADSNNKVWFSEYNHDKIGVVNRNISIPFDIRSFTNKVIILSKSTTNTTKGEEQQPQQKDKTTVVNFEISKSKKVQNEINNTNNLPQSNDKGYAIIFFKTSSSMTDFGLLNVTPNFSTDSIDLVKIKDGSKIPVQLNLQNDFKVNAGNYSLGISVTDGRVTKSIFLDLVLK